MPYRILAVNVKTGQRVQQSNLNGSVENNARVAQESADLFAQRQAKFSPKGQWVGRIEYYESKQ